MEDDDWTEDDPSEALESLRADCSRFKKQHDACVEVLELVIGTLFKDPEQAKNLALEIERIAVEREWRDEEHPAIPWLRKVRDDLFDWHHLKPLVQEAIARGEIRQIPLRERLVVLPGRQTPEAAPPVPSSAPPSGEH